MMRFGNLTTFGFVACAALGLVATTTGAGGCTEEKLAPAPRASSGSGGGAPTTSSSGGGAEPVRRTVVTRNPFGNVEAADNLLWDGDFEWLSSFADQYAWLYGKNINAIGYDLPKQVLGTACKSGVKCIELPKGGIALGSAVASKGYALEASVHVAVEGECGAITVALLGFGPEDPDVALDSKGRIDGWCLYQGVSSERTTATWLYVENGAEGPARVDDAVVRRAGQLALSKGFAAAVSRDFREVKRLARERSKPNPRVRGDAEARFIDELERRRTQ
jgi:hypothetical protein